MSRPHSLNLSGICPFLFISSLILFLREIIKTATCYNMKKCHFEGHHYNITQGTLLFMSSLNIAHGSSSAEGHPNKPGQIYHVLKFQVSPFKNILKSKICNRIFGKK